MPGFDVRMAIHVHAHSAEEALEIVASSYEGLPDGTTPFDWDVVPVADCDERDRPPAPPGGSYQDRDPARASIHGEGSWGLPFYVLPDGSSFLSLQEAIDRAPLVVSGLSEERTRAFSPKPLKLPYIPRGSAIYGNYAQTIMIAIQAEILLPLDKHLRRARDATFPAAALVGLTEPARELPSGNRLYAYKGGFALVMGKLQD